MKQNLTISTISLPYKTTNDSLLVWQEVCESFKSDNYQSLLPWITLDRSYIRADFDKRLSFAISWSAFVMKSSSSCFRLRFQFGHSLSLSLLILNPVHRFIRHHPWNNLKSDTLISPKQQFGWGSGGSRRVNDSAFWRRVKAWDTHSSSQSNCYSIVIAVRIINMLGVTSRRERTKVYAGTSRTQYHGAVPRLEDMCIRVLIANIDAISYLGDVPFYIMEPVLAKCSSPQLRRIEDLNPVSSAIM